MSVSKYFVQTSQQTHIESETKDLAEHYFRLENDLLSKLNELNYGPKIAYTYSPLQYASELHKVFLAKFLTTNKKVLFLGINPGPWGMCQTGIPFGEVNVVRDYLRIDGKVLTPNNLHPQRPIDGLSCKRSEVSGKRLWGLLMDLSENDPYKFFNHCFIHNYFPLALMDQGAKNITPADLKSKHKKKLEDICDESLSNIISLLNTETIVAIGKYAEKRSRTVIEKFKLDKLKVVTIPHPSPRSIGTEENWKNKTLNQFKSYEILELFK